MIRLWKYLTIYDRVLIISLVLLCVIAIFAPVGFLLTDRNDSNSEYVVVIQQANSNQQIIPMNSTYKKEPLYVKITGPLGISIIEVHNGKVRMKEAPPGDPEKICEKTGWIGQPGPMIICVPNQISIWIEREDSELDGVSW